MSGDGGVQVHASAEQLQRRRKRETKRSQQTEFLQNSPHFLFRQSLFFLGSHWPINPIEIEISHFPCHSRPTLCPASFFNSLLFYASSSVSATANTNLSSTQTLLPSPIHLAVYNIRSNIPLASTSGCGSSASMPSVFSIPPPLLRLHLHSKPTHALRLRSLLSLSNTTHRPSIVHKHTSLPALFDPTRPSLKPPQKYIYTCFLVHANLFLRHTKPSPLPALPMRDGARSRSLLAFPPRDIDNPPSSDLTTPSNRHPDNLITSPWRLRTDPLLSLSAFRIARCQSS
ncbi:hypothetical protein GALMADRAFT_140970 [Galerina marginata CBS 339.88]|uniref:Uncharacterized protein n=1 Tax=Galerina marginata (strain CBS 339.88) TaxID=685588 RepID=A0A067SUJ5_GALM3|nr:hypothetical protein GALMADRAFT_140970 [Galerina marginata CBS 339.88]